MSGNITINNGNSNISISRFGDIINTGNNSRYIHGPSGYTTSSGGVDYNTSHIFHPRALGATDTDSYISTPQYPSTRTPPPSNNITNTVRGSLMNLVAYGAMDRYLDQFSAPMSPPTSIRVDKLKTEKVCKEDCLICFESMKDTDLCECKECEILIHYKCLEKWIQTKNTCPHCRTNLNN